MRPPKRALQWGGPSADQHGHHHGVGKSHPWRCGQAHGGSQRVVGALLVSRWVATLFGHTTLAEDLQQDAVMFFD